MLKENGEIRPSLWGRRGHAVLKAQYHLLSDVILCLRNNIIIMYFDRYLSCFGIKIQIILANLYKLKIED